MIASSSKANQDYLREIGATPVRYGKGIVERVRAAAGGPVDAVFDVAGKTPVEELIGLAREPAQGVSIANFAAGQAGARVTGGGADSHPMQALAQVAELLSRNKLVIKVQTFPFHRAADAYRIMQSGHVRGKLVLILDRPRRPRYDTSSSSGGPVNCPGLESTRLCYHPRFRTFRPWLRQVTGANRGAQNRAAGTKGVAMATMKQAASAFLAKKRIAVTGVSRTAKGRGSNVVYQRLRSRGYEVFAINPNAERVKAIRPTRI